ncbi:MAG: cyclic lactone autoinducer peptide [Firmicutes bacterium]|nr:cyclic lactone autoinducer peptide [Bacillota bacterium]
MAKIKYLVLTGLVTIVTILATITAVSACAATHYQPELPKSLR